MSNTSAYYNENDPHAIAWLRGLIKQGLIAPGDVDDRSIANVRGDDLRGYTQVHFFAGIGGWSYALRLAEWPDDRPVWTGSCPCQPFSAAGKRRGVEDERHLWPEFYRLITECGPAIVFGEQVASKDGRGWLAGVRADLEALGYAVGAADLCAAGVGAPHIRQRLYWVADANEARRAEPGLGDVPSETRAIERTPPGEGRDGLDGYAFGSGTTGGLGDTSSAGLAQWASQRRDDEPERAPAERTGGAAVWLPCLDGKARRIEPGAFPLAYGVSARMGRLRGYGNAIVPQVAAEFIKAAT